ncbi:uncharacterized protein LOC143448502 [Clavelina lepadiformis]|uniref:uncharacterized protein LOC143448502 n=1 Tax=Clavelina lepadiformis TaxID=159417 RepID=UPI004041AD53
MGSMMGRLLQKRRVAVLMLGLDNTGKTTILYKVLAGKKIISAPTFGFNMEVLPFDDIELDVMDVGGDKKIVPLWKHYLLTASAIIYVMDCSDVQRIEENKTLLTDFMTRPERKKVPLLVIVNKTDILRYSVKAEDLKLRLDLHGICKARKYNVHMVSATTGNGLNEAFTWLCSTLGSEQASKKLKRFRGKQSKKQGLIKRQRSMDSNLTLSEHESITDDYGVLTSTRVSFNYIANPHEALISQRLNKEDQTEYTPNRIEERSFSFAESYMHINEFFHSKYADKYFVRSDSQEGNYSVTKCKPEKAAGTFIPSYYVDTLSNEPLSPLTSPRTATSMKLHRELKERTAAMRAKKANTISYKVSEITNSTSENKLDSIVRFYNQLSYNFDDKRNVSSSLNPQNNQIISRKFGDSFRRSSAEVQAKFLPHSSDVISRRRRRMSNHDLISGLHPQHKLDSPSVHRRSKSDATRTSSALRIEYKDNTINHENVTINSHRNFSLLTSVRLFFTNKKYHSPSATIQNNGHRYFIKHNPTDLFGPQTTIKTNADRTPQQVPTITVDPPTEDGTKSLSPSTSGQQSRKSHTNL